MIIASNNKGKIAEIKKLVPNQTIQSLQEANINIDIEEEGETFYDNALKKAQTIYELTHESVLADDSGLCIPYFDNWPGVQTHRFISGSDSERNEYIINKCQNLSSQERICHFI